MAYNFDIWPVFVKPCIPLTSCLLAWRLRPTRHYALANHFIQLAARRALDSLYRHAIDCQAVQAAAQKHKTEKAVCQKFVLDGKPLIV